MQVACVLFCAEQLSTDATREPIGQQKGWVNLKIFTDKEQLTVTENVIPQRAENLQVLENKANARVQIDIVNGDDAQSA